MYSALLSFLLKMVQMVPFLFCFKNNI
jgi:hypothetical protein